MDTEIWKPVVGYEGLYEVSNLGRIKSLNFRNKNVHEIMSLSKNYRGYLVLNLWKNRKKRLYRVHRLVAMTFLDNPLNLQEVLHIDNNPSNNNLYNIKWGTHQENMYQMNNEGRGTYKNNHPIKGKYGSNNPKSKKIIQYTLELNLIKEWASIADISRELGFSTGNISSCCKGKYKKAYGFIWKYKNP